ncbi:zinc ribbon domain-containing protein [Accumulibacter sp.]|uniref:FmdB family zinc ribbon protein n=1 Tax=Accumulibacter sp. TaxID=2053492 RepID=UPI0026204B2B|nr:zinc ribbon domain-containing protein [Accumulibacter sp.]
MPIYAYRCASCGFENDHLQKLSDPLLHICPQCGQATYGKQVTAAGFQLKGTGWYVTDFKDRQSKAPGAKEPGASEQAASTEKVAGTEKTASTEKAESTEKAPATACATGAGACADS